MGFKIVYSIEEHPLKDGTDTVWGRHMSVSLDKPTRVPSIEAVSLLCKEFGFKSLQECFVRFARDTE
jgi:hypothetical protein